MKNNPYLFLLCLGLSLSANTSIVLAQSLSPATTSPLIDHLAEINIHWLQNDMSSEELQQPVHFDDDQERIALHLEMVHHILKEKNIDHLNPTQQQKRNQLLQDLLIYAQANVFPTNSHHSQRQPYFVDHFETHCAVGYLMKQDEQADLIQTIRTHHNYAYLKELIGVYPEIETWAFNNGFTTDELVWIQPGYAPASHAFEQVGNGGGADGQINVMKTSYDEGLLYMAGDFSAVDGVPANSIIAWNGDSWETLGEGVNGEIWALEVDYNDNLYVAGDFVLNDDPTYSNVAVWNGEIWTGLQQGDMEGVVKTICREGNTIYIGGDFHMVDEQPISYLAKRGIGLSEWNNYIQVYVGPSTYDTIYDAFAINGPVHTLTPVENRLLIGGEFTQTAPDITNSEINQIDTDYAAYWFGNNWETGISGPHQPVSAMGRFEGDLYLGGSELEPNAVSIFVSGFWNNWHLRKLDSTDTETLVHGFVEYDQKYYAYGNILNEPIVGTYSKGFVQLVGQVGGVWDGGGALFDSTVRACEVFGNHLYFAGDFTTSGISEGTFEGLAYSALGSIPSSNVEQESNPIKVFFANRQLHIEYENLSENTTLNLYNINGQLIDAITLNEGAAKIQQDVSELADGIYVYEISNPSIRTSGKLAMF